ncbi:MAG: 7-carboxy-7-deazaguanine synthase QueE [Chloroflexi bacterium]|nr:7-carboxy-7-deazaguanine synthase QueE [Chloroflexota bacterium]
MLKLSRLPSGEPEIFASIQGEGATAGVPSVFVRLSLCNLRCSFCDTRTTWDWDRYDPKQEIITIDAADIVHRVEQAGPRNVVITGGEPLLQQRELAGLASELKARGMRIEVETNGTVKPEAPLAALIDQWNVSPKLAHSGNSPERREVPAALQWFAAQPSASFKFVVVGPGDLEEVETLVARYGVPTERVLLMPEGTDTATLVQRSRWLAERCVQTGFRYGPRLHVFLWGDERGR